MASSAAAADTSLSASSESDFAPRHSVNYAFVAKSLSSSHPDSSRPPRDEDAINHPGRNRARIVTQRFSVLSVSLWLIHARPVQPRDTESTEPALTPKA